MMPRVHQRDAPAASWNAWYFTSAVTKASAPARTASASSSAPLPAAHRNGAHAPARVAGMPQVRRPELSVARPRGTPPGSPDAGAPRPHPCRSRRPASRGYTSTGGLSYGAPAASPPPRAGGVGGDHHLHRTSSTCSRRNARPTAGRARRLPRKVPVPGVRNEHSSYSPITLHPPPPSPPSPVGVGCRHEGHHLPVPSCDGAEKRASSGPTARKGVAGPPRVKSRFVCAAYAATRCRKSNRHDRRGLRRRRQRPERPERERMVAHDQVRPAAHRQRHHGRRQIQRHQHPPHAQPGVADLQAGLSPPTRSRAEPTTRERRRRRAASWSTALRPA